MYLMIVQESGLAFKLFFPFSVQTFCTRLLQMPVLVLSVVLFAGVFLCCWSTPVAAATCKICRTNSTPGCCCVSVDGCCLVEPARNVCLHNDKHGFYYVLE